MILGKNILPILGSKILRYGSKVSIQFEFSSGPISWKKIKEKIFEREKYFQ